MMILLVSWLWLLCSSVAMKILVLGLALLLRLLLLLNQARSLMSGILTVGAEFATMRCRRFRASTAASLSTRRASSAVRFPLVSRCILSRCMPSLI